MIEDVVAPVLVKFCKARNLELDSKHGRILSKRGRKVTWQDRFGNAHDLDYVILRPSASTPNGRPVAFIEVAWRRYTKHSRNKAQEIQGALLPIAERYAHDRPFLGAVLAGVFTENSLAQLRSVGFCVLLFPYESIVRGFSEIGLDVRFDEATPDAVFALTVANIDALTNEQRQRVITALVRDNKSQIDAFVDALANSIDRRPTRIVIVPLFGRDHEFESVRDTLSFVIKYEAVEAGPLRKFDVLVAYSNQDRVEGVFSSRDEVIRFLNYISPRDQGT